jgi:hypothetical protein
MSKADIKEEVIERLDDFSKDLFEDISFKEGEDLTKPKKYMSIENVRRVLNECFEITFDKTTNK